VVCSPSSLTVSGAAKTAQCSVTLTDGAIPQNVVWIVNDTGVGSIGQDGVFRANGFAGGVVMVTAKVGTSTFSGAITVDFSQTNSNGVSIGDMTQLLTGGSADPVFRWLYPYDKTVFPRGLQPPLLQLDGSAASASYLKIVAPHFLYEAFNGPSNPLQIQIPPDVWKGVTYSAGATDWISVSVSKLSSGSVTGPVTEKWLSAQGSLHGALYYDTYNPASNPGFGAIIRVPFGGQAATLLTNSACGITCHSISANGRVLSAAVGVSASTTSSAVYDLDAAGNAILRPAGAVPGSLWHFAALTPDGSAGVPNISHNMPSVLFYDVVASGLVDTSSYNYITTPTFTPLYQHMPVFSPDGKKFAYVNGDQGIKAYSWILTVMDTDLSQTPPVFSNATDVITATANTEWVAWPSFLPDGNAILYHRGGSWETLSRNANIRMIDLQSGNLQKDLNALNGYDDLGSLYLPYGVTQDGDVNYQPSALTGAVGGYYWVLFVSRRSYGNTIWSGGLGGIDRFAANTPRKKIWVSAIDIDYPNRVDPSHPAFYLDGQELASGNGRPVGIIDACGPPGFSCQTRSDCCQGYCAETGRDGSGVPILQCMTLP
jgi:hypothetical protein